MSMETENTNKLWYALRVRSRHENLVASHLQARGFESLLPLYKCRRRWSDRFKEMQLPLFPGYVFCLFNQLNRLPILTIPGIVHVVGVGRTPLPIDETEMATILTAVQSGVLSRPWPFLQVGNKVRVEYGPLSGVEGILLGFRGHHRLVLSVTLLQRSVAVQVDEAWITPLPEQKRGSADTNTTEHLLSNATA
jgi:transcription antitermination factor NusG